MTVSLKSVVISVPSCYLWDSNFYTFLSTARLVLAVATTPPAHSSSRRTCCTLLWKPLSSHAVSIPFIPPWYPHPSSRQPVHILTLGGSLGSDLYFASGSGLSAVTQDEPKLECVSLDEVIRGGLQYNTIQCSLFWEGRYTWLTQLIQNACLGYCYYTVFRSILPRKSWAAPRHGARVRYLLGTDVKTPFFQAPTAEFGHRVRVCTVFLFSSGAIHCFVFPAMVKFQSGVWQGESRRLTTYTVTYRRVLKVWTQGHFVLVPRH